jgi:hypothetical protein
MTRFTTTLAALAAVCLLAITTNPAHAGLREIGQSIGSTAHRITDTVRDRAPAWRDAAARGLGEAREYVRDHAPAWRNTAQQAVQESAQAGRTLLDGIRSGWSSR